MIGYGGMVKEKQKVEKRLPVPVLLLSCRNCSHAVSANQCEGKAFAQVFTDSQSLVLAIQKLIRWQCRRPKDL